MSKLDGDQGSGTTPSVENVVAAQPPRDRWSRVVTAVFNSSPGTLIGARWPLRPQDPIELHLKGEVSPQVVEVIKKTGLAIIVRDGQPYSLDELTELQALMRKVLRGLGIDDIASSVGLPADGARVYLVYSRQHTDMDNAEVRRILAGRLPQPFMTLLSMQDDGSNPAWIPQSGEAS